MKTIKTAISLVIIISMIIYTLPLHAQGKHDKDAMSERRMEIAQKIKASKIAFITEHLELTPEEAEKFWPVYNEMEKNREESTKKIMERFKSTEEEAEMTDEKAMEVMEARFKQEKDLLDMKLEYHDRFMNILPASKVLKLYQVEDRFRRHLMERFDRGRREGERMPEGREMAPPHRGRMQHR